jgi:hypothetical protein
MSRGTILGLSREKAVERVLSQILFLYKNVDGKLVPIAYRLKDVNGGDNPRSMHCAGISYGGRTPTADCIGLVLWASGIDRKQPGYDGLLGEWLNCKSLLSDARREKRYCRYLTPRETALPGDWLLTPDHIGMIVRPDPDPAGGFDHLVVDCSPRHGRDRAVNTGYPWSEACVVVRPSTLIYPAG